MKWVIILAALLLGCAPIVPAKGSSTEEVWVCHNPESSWHGAICNEECYWDDFERAKDSYCWLLREKDCAGELEFAWQRDNCHLLGVENVEVHCGID